MNRAQTARTTLGLAIVAAVFSTSAHAHPGHVEGAFSGLLHPLMGLDHVLAMVAVGIWASLLGRRAYLWVPASFLAAMTLAALAGMGGLNLPMVELGIAASVLLAGVLIGLRIQIRVPAGAALVGLFALFHGFAHGTEIPASVTAGLYIAGFVFSTAALHALGVMLGSLLMKWKPAMPATGAALFAGGTWMLAGLT